MAIIFPIHRAINRPISFKGLKGVFIILAGLAMIGDLLAFVLLYFCGVHPGLCMLIALSLGALSLATLRWCSQRYGPQGITRRLRRRSLPRGWRIRHRETIIRNLANANSSNPNHLRQHASFPIFEVCKGILSVNNDFSLGFELTLPPAGSLSAEEYEQAGQAHVKALQAFPPGTILHWMDWYTEDSYRAEEGGGEDHFLKDASGKHFDKRPFLRHRCFVFITQSKRFKEEHIPEHEEDCARWAHFLGEEGGINVRLLTTKELEGVIESYCSLNHSRERQLFDIQLGNHIRVGNTIGFIYSLCEAEGMPATCSRSVRYEPYSTDVTDYPIGFASAFGSLLSVEHIYNQVIQIAEPAVVVSRLERHKQRAAGMAVSRENETTAQAIDDFLNDAAQQQSTMVRAHYSLYTWADDEHALPGLKREVAISISKRGAIPHLETISTPELWLAGIPGNARSLPPYAWFDTFAAQACCFVSGESNNHSSKPAFGMRLGERFTGIPQLVDFSDEPRQKGWIDNRNKTVIGGSGSGKSFFLNSLVHWYLLGRSHVMIIDIGGSYRRLCQLMGGTYLTYDEQQPIQFNPFRLDRGTIPDIEKIESLKALLATVWKKDNDGLSQAEYLTLSRAIKGYYEYLRLNPAIPPGLDSLYEYTRDVFAPWLKEEGNQLHFDIAGFLYVLRPFYKGGEYDYLLNARDQASFLDTPFLVFELDTIADHPILYPVVTIIIMQSFIAKLRTLKGIRKVLLIEEAWKPLMRPASSGYIRWLFKTARKFFGEIIVATQDLEDLIGNAIVKNTIINNTDCKILTDCRKFQNRFHELQQLLSLTEKEKIQALSLNKANDVDRRYKEVFVSYAKGPSNVYRNEVSLEEYLIYTTEQKEQLLLDGYVHKEGSLRKGVAALATDIRAGVVQLLLILAMVTGLLAASVSRANAQVAEIIDAVVKKALMAADLDIQRQQTSTIALQTAQKETEMGMQNSLLSDIASWAQQTQMLFSDYYQQLWQVKSVIGTMGKVETMIRRQAQLVSECQRDWSLVQQDNHFSMGELSHIGQVYQVLLDESSRNIQQLGLVIQSFFTQMDDAGRLQLIDETGKQIESNYGALRRWTGENMLLSTQRARSQSDLQSIQILYGIQ